MISFAKMMRDVLLERMSFGQLYGRSEYGRRSRGNSDVSPNSTQVTATDTGEAWSFNYKSNPSTTGQRWHGFIQFFKNDVSRKNRADELDCMIDCDCPDYRYRYAYNNEKAGVGWTGKHPEWKYNNQNNGQKWKPRSQGGVGNYGVGLCKHLCSLRDYLRTVIEPNAPDPDDEIPPAVKTKKVQRSQVPVSQKPATTKAPTPDDSYSDSRSGSDTLQEKIQPVSSIYKLMDKFVKTHPTFMIPDYDSKSVNETESLQEAHSRGEWWIDESGSTIFADGNVGESNHEAVVITSIAHEILSHFGIDVDDAGTLGEYEDNIKETLIDDDRLSEDEIAQWDRNALSVIVTKLIEDKAFGNGDLKQTQDAVHLAYGNTFHDARDYAMQYWRWKVMKTHGGEIEIQTWHLTPDDLGIIVRGVWDIMEEPDEDDDSDSNIGEDGYPGPRVNVTVQASGKRFSDIPLAVLEKKMPQNLHNYQSGVHVGYTESITEEFHHLHKEYRLYEGNRHIIALFEDGTRLKFEIHFRDKHGPDREKWRHRAFTTWKSVANEIRKASEELDEVGNSNPKSWRSCFKEALEDPRMKDYMRKNSHRRIFDNKENAPIYDPVNFTRMG
jgi:hypothetical protein